MHGHLERISVSGYSDLSKLSPQVFHLHFRKFLSKNLIIKSISMCSGLESISLSRYALSRCDPECLEFISDMGMEFLVSERERGRPNLLEKNKFKRIKAKLKKSREQRIDARHGLNGQSREAKIGSRPGVIG